MIKVTYISPRPTTMWLNPAHIVWVNERSDHTCNIRLMNGDTYQVQESGELIHDQMLAWQHRTHQ